LGGEQGIELLGVQTLRFGPDPGRLAAGSEPSGCRSSGNDQPVAFARMLAKMVEIER
jgi:hypothetical protein